MTPLVDTNVLARFLTSDEDPKYSHLYAFFESLEQGGMEVELKLIVLFQTLFVLTSFYKIPKQAVSEALKSLISYKGIKIRGKRVIQRALELWQTEKSLEIVDCYLMSCLEGESPNWIYSYDKDFDRFGFNRKEP